MRSEILVLLSIDNADVDPCIRPDQYFANVLKNWREEEPELEIQVEMGTLAMRRAKQRAEAEPQEEKTK